MMRKWFLAAAALSSLAPASAEEQDSIRWLNDYKQASFESRQTGKPMFVVFR